MKNTTLKYIAGSVLLAGLLTGAASGCTETVNATEKDQQASEDIQSNFQKAQPVPFYKYSQHRENLKAVLKVQAEGAPTTSFAFNQGVADPILSCPSVGFPIASTTQLTNPLRIEDRYEGDVAIPQIEPNGTFTGDSSGTYVVCRDANGNEYGDYWEGNVNTVSGPAEWDYDKKQIVLIGAPTGDFSAGE